MTQQPRQCWAYAHARERGGAPQNGKVGYRPRMTSPRSPVPWLPFSTDMAEQEDPELLGMSGGAQSGRGDKRPCGKPMRRPRRPRRCPVNPGSAPLTCRVQMSRQTQTRTTTSFSALSASPDRTSLTGQRLAEGLAENEDDALGLPACLPRHWAAPSAMRVKKGLHGQAFIYVRITGILLFITVLWPPAGVRAAGEI